MNRDHQAFAAEMRRDACELRAMAADLDARAAEHEAMPAPAETDLERVAFLMNMTPEAYRVHLATRHRPADAPVPVRC